MVTKLEPKTEGNSGACIVCGSNVIWVEKSWQGKTSLTLRNSSDQKAHNVKDSQGGWTCSTGVSATNQSVASKAIESKVVWSDPGELSEDEQALYDGLVRVEELAYKRVKEQQPDLSENSNIFGQIVNAKSNQLIGLLEIKAIKDSGKNV
tara:strand:+ start:232 stop:681 length:450 start_codon:yes stop_codon:yes gene_type:complete